MSNNAPPPRWLHCPRIGRIMPDPTPFLPCKTPLSANFNETVPEEHRFTPGMLVDGVEGQNRELGMVIDLTKTDRFYDTISFTEDNVKHLKIKCAGFEQVPSAEQVNKFIAYCKGFWRDNPRKVIGVHCTHGFNRTGYMIISYLVREQSLSVEAAFQLFKDSRDPGIYKGHYIDELSNSYSDGADSMITPDLPSWCTGSDDTVDDEGEQHNRKRRRLNDNGGGKFMEGVGGIHPVQALILRDLQKKCCNLAGKKGVGFPGSQPVSLDITNIKLLHHMPYNVSWKADGFRYMMLIVGENQIYMVDRDFMLFKVSTIKFVFSRDINAHLTDTLLDGEMVIDKDGDQKIPRYLIYDIITLNGKFVGDQNHDVRLKIVQKEIIDPRRHAMSKNMIDRQAEPFGIRKKDFWPLSVNKLRWVLETFMPTLAHENDGVILSPVMKPYTLGTTQELFKWKPSSLNSVDFLLHVEENKPIPGMLPGKVGKLFVGGMDTPYAQVPATKKIRELHRRIVECVWKNNTWEVIRVREDKSFPNSYTTAQNVVHSIRHPITQKCLLEYVEKFGWRAPVKQQSLNGDQKLMPPPPLKRKPSNS